MFTESLNVSKMSMLYYNGLCGSVLTVDTTNANVQVVSHLKDCSSLIMTAVVSLFITPLPQYHSACYCGCESPCKYPTKLCG